MFGLVLSFLGALAAVFALWAAACFVVGRVGVFMLRAFDRWASRP